MQGKKGGRENDLFLLLSGGGGEVEGGKPIFRLFARLFKKAKHHH